MSAESLERARQARRERQAAGLPAAERLSPVERAKRNPTSLRLAVNAKCWDCVGGDADPNPRLRIRSCEILSCPLWNVRPGRGGRGGADSTEITTETVEETEEEGYP